jgi:hypothetical protein
MIGGVQSSRGGARTEVTSRPSTHNRHIYFIWRTVAADSIVAVDGVDFGSQDEDGRISSIDGFFGPRPSLDG